MVGSYKLRYKFLGNYQFVQVMVELGVTAYIISQHSNRDFMKIKLF